MADKCKPVVLIVRDGWGVNPNSEHDAFNAVKIAKTPVCDRLLGRYTVTMLHTSGEEVGLPDGTMGNSEVGHQNLGAGRVVDQESVRISKAIRDESFFDNSVLVDAVESAKANGKYVHIFGIASDAGVHGLMTHLYACVELCKRRGHDKVALHLFTDGRDTGPYTGKVFIEEIEAKLREIGIGQIASVTGRYYAMDRDNRWERVQRAYDLLTGRGESLPNFTSAQAAVQDYYDNPTNDSQRGDEFITPRTVGADWQDTRVGDGDSIIFYNYRGDRPRELTRAFVMPTFEGEVKPSPDSGRKGFDRGPKSDVRYVTMTEYESTLGDMVQVAFARLPKMVNTAGEFISDAGLRQFRCAETEKFPHVTFFFNDYREEPFPGETRQMAQSPRVATYDLQPAMSADEVCGYVLGRLNADDCEDFILVNFANADMVGHTGKLQAAVQAVETVDACVGRIVEATLALGGAAIVTADHGNAEQMWDPVTKAAHTAHTTYDVECIVVAQQFDGRDVHLRKGGRLADVMPTVLGLMGLTPPKEMTGRSLIT